MITQVTKYLFLLDSDPVSGFRVKRRQAAPTMFPPVTVTVLDDFWDDELVPSISLIAPDGSRKDYVLAFWSLTAEDTLPPQPHQQSYKESRAETGTHVSDSHIGGAWTVVLKAYYVWNFGTGPGNHALLIDGFDI